MPGFGAFPWCGLQGLCQRPPVVQATPQVPMVNMGQVRWCSNLTPGVLVDVSLGSELQVIMYDGLNMLLRCAEQQSISKDQLMM